MTEDNSGTDYRRENAIETKYSGYRFRSRLEARWAVFFDAADIEWRFEHEGFELPSGEWYLPDFYLPNIGIRSVKKSPLWVEIKPTKEYADFELAEEFVRSVGEDIAVLTGEAGEDGGRGNFQIELKDDKLFWDNDMHFMKCVDCGAVKYEFKEGNYMTCESCGAKCTYRHDTFEVATERARSKRFSE